MQICEPVVNGQLHRMNWLQRTAECFRYFLLSAERWMSPDGKLREWVKINARMSVFLATPTFMALPVAVAALRELSSCMNALTTIAAKLVFLPVLTLLYIVIFRLPRA